MNEHLDGAINKMRLANMRLNEARGEASSLEEIVHISIIQDDLAKLMDRLRDLYKEDK